MIKRTVSTVKPVFYYYYKIRKFAKVVCENGVFYSFN